jgi:predicted Zn-dependent protease
MMLHHRTTPNPLACSSAISKPPPVLGNATSLALLGYSREQEDEADAAALAAVVALYGHGAGMAELFASLGSATPTADVPASLLRSHPLTLQRMEAMHRRAASAGWSMTGARAPMPAPPALDRRGYARSRARLRGGLRAYP